MDQEAPLNATDAFLKDLGSCKGDPQACQQRISKWMVSMLKEGDPQNINAALEESRFPTIFETLMALLEAVVTGQLLIQDWEDFEKEIYFRQWFSPWILNDNEDIDCNKVNAPTEVDCSKVNMELNCNIYCAHAVTPCNNVNVEFVSNNVNPEVDCNNNAQSEVNCNINALSEFDCNSNNSSTEFDCNIVHALTEVDCNKANALAEIECNANALTNISCNIIAPLDLSSRNNDNFPFELSSRNNGNLPFELSSRDITIAQLELNSRNNINAAVELLQDHNGNAPVELLEDHNGNVPVELLQDHNGNAPVELLQDNNSSVPILTDCNEDSKEWIRASRSYLAKVSVEGIVFIFSQFLRKYGKQEEDTNRICLLQGWKEVVHCMQDCLIRNKGIDRLFSLMRSDASDAFELFPYEQTVMQLLSLSEGIVAAVWHSTPCSLKDSQEVVACMGEDEFMDYIVSRLLEIWRILLIKQEGIIASDTFISLMLSKLLFRGFSHSITRYLIVNILLDVCCNDETICNDGINSNEDAFCNDENICNEDDYCSDGINPNDDSCCNDETMCNGEIVGNGEIHRNDKINRSDEINPNEYTISHKYTNINEYSNCQNYINLRKYTNRNDDKNCYSEENVMGENLPTTINLAINVLRHACTNGMSEPFVLSLLENISPLFYGAMRLNSMDGEKDSIELEEAHACKDGELVPCVHHELLYEFLSNSIMLYVRCSPQESENVILYKCFNPSSPNVLSVNLAIAVIDVLAGVVMNRSRLESDVGVVECASLFFILFTNLCHIWADRSQMESLDVQKHVILSSSICRCLERFHQALQLQCLYSSQVHTNLGESVNVNYNFNKYSLESQYVRLLLNGVHFRFDSPKMDTRLCGMAVAEFVSSCLLAPMAPPEELPNPVESDVPQELKKLLFDELHCPLSELPTSAWWLRALSSPFVYRQKAAFLHLCSIASITSPLEKLEREDLKECNRELMSGQDCFRLRNLCDYITSHFSKQKFAYNLEPISQGRLLSVSHELIAVSNDIISDSFGKIGNNELPAKEKNVDQTDIKFHCTHIMLQVDNTESDSDNEDDHYFANLDDFNNLDSANVPLDAKDLEITHPPMYISQCYERLIGPPHRSEVHPDVVENIDPSKPLLQYETACQKRHRLSQTLIHLPRIIAKCEPDLDRIALPLFKCLLILDNIVDIPNFEDLRMAALVQLMVYIPRPLVMYIKEELLEQSWTIVQRLLMLRCIQESVRILSGRVSDANDNFVLKSLSDAKSTDKGTLALLQADSFSQVSHYSIVESPKSLSLNRFESRASNCENHNLEISTNSRSRRITTATKIIQGKLNRFIPHAELFFYSLSSQLMNFSSSQMLEGAYQKYRIDELKAIHQRCLQNGILLGGIIHSLSECIECAGPACPYLTDMITVAADIVKAYRFHPDSHVRRCTFSLAARFICIGSLQQLSICLEGNGGLELYLKWLIKSCTDDADTMCRNLACLIHSDWCRAN